jgi:streptogramin lyase
VTVQAGPSPEGVTALDGSLWTVLEDSGRLVQVDPGTGNVTHRYPIDPGPRLVLAGGGSLWISSYSTGRIVALDPHTGARRTSSSVCEGPQGMLFTDSTVWVACTLGNELVGLDRRTLEVSGRLPLAGSPDAVSAGPDGTVLVALQGGPTLAVIDPTGSKVVGRVRLGHVDQLYDRPNVDLLVQDRTAWVSSYLEGGVCRVRL